MSYEPTANEDIVKKVTETDIDMSVFITEYLDLKQQLLNLPQLKTVPDQETLTAFNFERQIEIDDKLNHINSRATLLYGYLVPIVNAGLLPAKFLDEFTQLENYINNL